MATSSFNINELVASHGDKGLLATALVDKTAHEQLEEQLQHQRRGHKVYIRNVLNVKDSEIIRNRYGGKYDLHLTQQELAPHGLAGALRLCETLDCLDFFPRSGLGRGLGPKSDGELYIFNSECVVCNSESLSAATRSLQAPTGTISQVDGVAGCGKTTAIKSIFEPSTDMIVTANKKSAQDVRMALFKSSDSKEACAFVRTADSVLLNEYPKQAWSSW